MLWSQKACSPFSLRTKDIYTFIPLSLDPYFPPLPLHDPFFLPFILLLLLFHASLFTMIFPSLFCCCNSRDLLFACNVFFLKLNEYIQYTISNHAIRFHMER